MTYFMLRIKANGGLWDPHGKEETARKIAQKVRQHIVLLYLTLR